MYTYPTRPFTLEPRRNAVYVTCPKTWILYYFRGKNMSVVVGRKTADSPDLYKLIGSFLFFVKYLACIIIKFHTS